MSKRYRPNQKCYGRQRAHGGRPPSPYSAMAIIDVKPPVDDPYERLLELAEGLMRKGYDEEYAMWKAAEMCERRDERVI